MFLLWSHGFSMCSLHISVLFVLMRVEISLFSSGIQGSAWLSMLVNVLFASCMSVGGCSAVKASSVSCVNLSHSAFL